MMAFVAMSAQTQTHQRYTPAPAAASVAAASVAAVAATCPGAREGASSTA